MDQKMHFHSGIFYETFPLFRMTQCNTATLTLDPILVLQIAF